MLNSNTLKYTFGGLLFGLFFPVLSWLIDALFVRELAFNWDTIIQLHTLNPIHFVIDSAPFIVAGTFAAVGFYIDKIKQNQNKKIIDSKDSKQYSTENKAILKKLRIGNILTPIIVSFLLLCSYWVIHNFLSEQQSNAAIINTSGKQRMLSQKISKNALYLSITKNKERIGYVNTLNKKIKEFETAQRNLISKENTLRFNSTQIISLYDSLNPYYNGILAGVEELLEANQITNIEERKVSLDDAIQKIKRNEQAFFPIMNQIVKQYEKEANKKIGRIKIIQLIIVIILSLFFILSAILGFSSMIDRVKTAFLNVEVASNLLEKNNKELQVSEEELRKNTTRLKSTNEYLSRTQQELATYIRRVTEAKKMAKLAVYEVHLKENEIVHTDLLNELLKINSDKEITVALLENYIHIEDYKIVMESQQKSIKEKESTFYRFRLKTEGYNDWQWFEGTTQCVLNRKGEVWYIINSLQDITDTVKQEQEIAKLLEEVNFQNQELQASAEELRQNSEQLQKTNDNLFVAQREVEEKTRLLSRAEQLSQIGSFEIGTQNLMFSHSENLSNIYELPEEEITDIKAHQRYYRREEGEKIQQSFAKLLRGEENSFSLTGHFTPPNQTKEKVIKIEATLIRDSAQNPERILGVVQDVTLITLQKISLKQSQKQLESLSNNLQGIMYRALIDKNWTMKFISRGVERITGYAVSDFLDNKVRSFASIIHPEDNFIDVEINQAIETKQPYKIEYRLIHQNGSIIWVEETGQVMEDKINNINYLDGVLMDITQRKHTEKVIDAQTKKLLESQKELEEQQQMLSDAEKMAKIGSYIWNLQTREIKHSENLPTIYGLEKDTIINQIIFDAIIHPEERETHQRKIAEAIMNGEREVFTTYRAKPPHLSKNYWRNYRTYSIINYNEQGEPITLIGTAQDISEEVAQQQMQQELLSYVKDNKDNLEESQRIAQIVSYDMDIHTKKIEWSDSFDKVFEVENYQIPQDTQTFQEWIEDIDLHRLNESWAEAVAQKKEFNAIYRIKTPNQKLVYVRERGYPIFDDTENFTKMKGTIQDITNAELARQKLEKTSDKLETQNTNLLASINYAQRIQSAMLGGTQDLKKIFKDAFVFFEPKDIVSGDFYWYNEIGTRKIAIVGDCTGHGVPGAFMSLLGTTLLNEVILQRQVTTPSKILDFIQTEIRKILKQDTTGNRDGMDMAVVIVDTSVGMMEFAGAKNPLIYINKKQKNSGGIDTDLKIIKGDIHPIGGRSERNMNAKYTNHSIDIKNIEAIYIYSDGYQDQFGGERGRKFMSNKFRELLYNTHNTSMHRQRVALKRNLMNWMGTEYEQVDDICVMGITI